MASDVGVVEPSDPRGLDLRCQPRPSQRAVRSNFRLDSRPPEDVLSGDAVGGDLSLHPRTPQDGLSSNPVGLDLGSHSRPPEDTLRSHFRLDPGASQHVLRGDLGFYPGPPEGDCGGGAGGGDVSRESAPPECSLDLEGGDGGVAVVVRVVGVVGVVGHAGQSYTNKLIAPQISFIALLLLSVQQISKLLHIKCNDERLQYLFSQMEGSPEKEERHEKQTVVNMAKEVEAVGRKKLSVVIVSDTHGSYKQLNKILQLSGDVFIHAGDFTDYGRERDFLAFFKYLERLNFRHKVVIAGNHEIALDNGCIQPHRKAQYLSRYPCSLSREELISALRERCIYLEHEAVEIEGVRIFGSPYTPYYVGNAFQYPLHREKVIWEHVPPQLDLLVTHGPPLDILDLNSHSEHSGSVHLRQVVLQRRPKYHVFGHIHESMGMFKAEGVNFLNVANEPTRLLI